MSALRSQDYLLILLAGRRLLLQSDSFLVSHLITPQTVLVEAGKAEDEEEGLSDCDDVLMLTCLFTTIGMGRVRVKTPSIAHSPPNTLPRNV